MLLQRYLQSNAARKAGIKRLNLRGVSSYANIKLLARAPVSCPFSLPHVLYVRAKCSTDLALSQQRKRRM